MTRLQFGAWRWYKGLTWVAYAGPEGTALWMRYFREALWMRDHSRREREMMELAA